MKQKGLGRGLDAIFGTENIAAKVTPMSHMAQIPIGQIVPNPSQPRTSFDEEALRELSDSIRQLGIIQPITVRRDGTDRYIIISGERRWRASRMAGLETLPAYVREADDENLHAMALVENIQRQDLNAIEIALGMQRLIDECGLTQEQMADKVGKKRSTVSNYMRLLTLPDEVQLALKEGLISMGHAKALAALPRQMQVKALKKCLRGGLSVRQTEELARKAAQTPAPVPAPEEEEYPESYSRLVEQLEQAGRILSGERRDVLLALLALGNGQLLGVLARKDHHVAHIVILGLDAAHDVVLLGLGQDPVELAQTHAHKIGHLLLLHARLELEELKGAEQVVVALAIGLGLLLEGAATVAHEARGAVELVEELGVQVLGNILLLGSRSLVGLGSLLGHNGLLNLSDLRLSRSNLGCDLNLGLGSRSGLRGNLGLDGHGLVLVGQVRRVNLLVHLFHHFCATLALLGASAPSWAFRPSQTSRLPTATNQFMRSRAAYRPRTSARTKGARLTVRLVPHSELSLIGALPQTAVAVAPYLGSPAPARPR